MDPYSVQMMLMNQVGRLSELFVDQVRSILFALALFILGLMVSEIIKYLSLGLLRLLRWDALARRLGWAAVLQKYRADVSPSEAVSELFFWVALLSFLMKSLQRLDVLWLSRLGDQYFSLLPGLFGAAALLLGAWILARWLGRFVHMAVAHPTALLAGGLAQAVVFTLGLYFALLAVGLDPNLVQPMVLIILGGTVFGLAWGWAHHREKLFRTVVRVQPGEGE